MSATSRDLLGPENWGEQEIANLALFQLVLEEPLVGYAIDAIAFERVCGDCGAALFTTPEPDLADAFAVGTPFNDRLAQLIEKPVEISLAS